MKALCCASLLLLIIAMPGAAQPPASGAKPTEPNRLSDEEAKAGFVLMFDGKTLDGLKAQNKDFFRVEEGKLIADGTKGRSMLFYVGPDGKASLPNFDLRLQVLTHKGGNSGIYFRTKWQDAGFPDKFGYEAQIANTHSNAQKTGCLYKINKINPAPAKDGEWFDYQIVADGRKITISVDGKVVTEYTEPDDEAKRRPLGDLIALQGHDPAVVEFRTIRVKSLNK